MRQKREKTKYYATFSRDADTVWHSETMQKSAVKSRIVLFETQVKVHEKSKTYLNSVMKVFELSVSNFFGKLFLEFNLKF